ncbi:hypothetical protein [Parafrankia sp. EUN1f]|uniref:restriction system modified-DNA reader domain-containing protein n=1 Tax=Parafrankia sp. EUN1f TaxID=102897 RepID=UPI00350EEA52
MARVGTFSASSIVAAVWRASCSPAARTLASVSRPRHSSYRPPPALAAGAWLPNRLICAAADRVQRGSVWRGTDHRATLLAAGRVRTESGGRFGSPSAAAKDATDANAGAWNFWKVDETNARLDAVRAQYPRIHGGAGRPTAGWRRQRAAGRRGGEGGRCRSGGCR